MIYFTSDLHLGHKGIISMQNRPFENVAEMNRTIINNYNSCVNHDKKYDERLFEEICDFKEIAVNGSNIVLMHYPMMSWPKSRKGSIQLHGHIHGDEFYNIRNREKGIKRYDVGVDANRFIPVSIKQIQEYFQIEEGVQPNETILTIEWRKSDILAALREKGIEVSEEQFEDFIDSTKKIRYKKYIVFITNQINL